MMQVDKTITAGKSTQALKPRTTSYLNRDRRETYMDVLSILMSYRIAKRLNLIIMLVKIYVNGTWDASLENNSEVVIFDKGNVYELDDSLYNSFIDKLEEKGYDCYFCPELFKHPEWNGIIKYEVN